MRFLFDTDIIISYFNRNDPTTVLVEDILQKAPLVAISTLTITEVRTGWTKEKAVLYMPKLYDLFTIEPVTLDIAEQAGVWRHDYLSKGKSLSTPDTVIAATAYLRDFLLVTKNTKDYPMPELRLYDGEV
jgi:predicted nucleic acid-binding protein